MANRLTKGTMLTGEVKFPGGNKAQKIMTGSVARTNTSGSPAVIGTLPKGSTITDVTIWAAAASNAATTATLSVGKAGGTGTEIINAYDVKGSGAGQRKATTEATLGTGPSNSADITVQGVYAETGTASTSGGPWLVAIEYV